jgi:hypothetical protein
MRHLLSQRQFRAAVGRAFAEIAFIVFLFYANLLMGEYTAANGHGKTLHAALHNIFTRKTILIAVVSSLLGYPFFEFLRHRADPDAKPIGPR